MEKEFQIIAKTFKGLENVLAKELVELGANNVQIDRRAVTFTGDKALLYKANLYLRTASRILKPILTFKAKHADEVYNQIKSIDWSKYLNVKQTFAIDSTVYSEEFRNSQFVKYRVKDAIVDWFMEHEDKRPSIRIDNPDIYLNIHISHNQCTLSLDSSGESLHKRGYRDSQTEAPINEALAAGMLLMAGWNGQCDFIDPMCGSGTLLIEAALIALNIPPCIYRKSFAFEQWQDFDSELFNALYNDDSNEREFEHQIIGGDISPRALKIAEANIRAAGLNKYIKLIQRDIADWETQQTPCLVVTNPPYGERLTSDDLFGIYAKLGETLKHKFAGSTAWVVSSSIEGLQKIGLHPSQKIELLNGALDCEFREFELFSGKRNDFVKDRKTRKPAERFLDEKKEKFSTEKPEKFARKPRQERDFHEKPFRKERKPFERKEEKHNNFDRKKSKFDDKKTSFGDKKFKRDERKSNFDKGKPKFDKNRPNNKRRFDK